MSYNDIMPIELLTNGAAITRKEIKNPIVTIPLDYLVSCNISYTIEGRYGVLAASVDHPAFDELRKGLAAAKLIKIPAYPCWNGDRVTKRFQFNGMQLEVGDKFYCAGAWNYYKKDMK